MDKIKSTIRIIIGIISLTLAMSYYIDTKNFRMASIRKDQYNIMGGKSFIFEIPYKLPLIPIKLHFSDYAVNFLEQSSTEINITCSVDVKVIRKSEQTKEALSRHYLIK